MNLVFTTGQSDLRCRHGLVYFLEVREYEALCDHNLTLDNADVYNVRVPLDLVQDEA
jgi:hypothetical protein